MIGKCYYMQGNYVEAERWVTKDINKMSMQSRFVLAKTYEKTDRKKQKKDIIEALIFD